MLLKRMIPLAFLNMLAIAAANAQWEVEVDPFSYIQDGYSIHVANNPRTNNTRLQLGVFAADIPRWAHGDDEFDVRVRGGVSLKGDYFLFERTSEWFVGLDANYFRMRYRLRDTGETSARNRYGLGPRFGYRHEIGEDLYVTPWVSVLYIFNADDITISNVRFSDNRYVVLPTIHIGWRF